MRQCLDSESKTTSYFSLQDQEQNEWVLNLSIHLATSLSLSSEQAGAKEFYSKYFGWTFRDSPLPPEMGGGYTTWLLGDKEVGAAYQLNPNMKGVGLSWPRVT